jgi:hypothetical protein
MSDVYNAITFATGYSNSASPTQNLTSSVLAVEECCVPYFDNTSDYPKSLLTGT